MGKRTKQLLPLSLPEISLHFSEILVSQTILKYFSDHSLDISLAKVLLSWDK